MARALEPTVPWSESQSLEVLSTFAALMACSNAPATCTQCHTASTMTAIPVSCRQDPKMVISSAKRSPTTLTL